MVKSVRAAVQRTQWVVVFYFGCQSRNIRNRNIRRIGNQHIQRQPQSRGQIVIKPAGFQPGDLRFQSELPSILRGNLQCFGGAIYPLPVPKLVLGQQRQQNTAGAGSEIGYILSNRTIKQFQGLLDNNFRIRTGRQHFFADIELIFVESPAAENFIHRFMSQTFPQHRIEPFPLSGGQFTAEQNRLIGRNAAGRSQQQPSFQPRRFNSGSGKAACHIVQQ